MAPETRQDRTLNVFQLQLRGPGEIEGTQQSGTLNFKIADIVTDGPILREARITAMEILRSDPHLELAQHRPLKVFLESRKRGKLAGWSRIS